MVSRISKVRRAQHAPAATTPPESSGNDDILFIGLNPNSAAERRVLASGKGAVQSIADALTPDRVHVRRVTYDLTTRAGIDAFVATLGLPGGQAQRVARVLASGEEDSRDEVAQLARIWAKAEKGEKVPARVVVSAHYVGEGPVGENNGKLAWNVLESLATIMPRAAAQIEDVHLAMCNSGYLSMDRMQRVFPRVQTVWGYRGSAPAAGRGSAAHLRVWEQATRGKNTQIDASAAQRTRHGGNVVIWTRGGGLVGAPARPISALRAEYKRLAQLFDKYFEGRRTVADPQRGELRDYYNVVQEMLSRPEISAREAEALKDDRDVAVRLLYYDRIRKRFEGTFHDRLVAGYRAAGMVGPPNFARLSRAEALAEVERFEQAAAKYNLDPPTPTSVQHALEFLDCLRSLNNYIVVEGWL